MSGAPGGRRSRSGGRVSCWWKVWWHGTLRYFISLQRWCIDFTLPFQQCIWSFCDFHCNSDQLLLDSDRDGVFWDLAPHDWTNLSLKCSQHLPRNRAEVALEHNTSIIMS